MFSKVFNLKKINKYLLTFWSKNKMMLWSKLNIWGPRLKYLISDVSEIVEILHQTMWMCWEHCIPHRVHSSLTCSVICTICFVHTFEKIELGHNYCFISWYRLRNLELLIYFCQLFFTWSPATGKSKLLRFGLVILFA